MTYARSVSLAMPLFRTSGGAGGVAKREIDPQTVGRWAEAMGGVDGASTSLLLRQIGTSSGALKGGARMRGVRRPEGARGPIVGPLTVIFTDVERSTELYTARGDDVAGGVMDAHAAIVNELTTRHGGWQIKSLGDGFLLAFASVRAALACAIGIQRATAEDSQEHPERAVRVRIGINTGEVIRTDDDVAGQAVIAAARIMACAEPGEILVSRVVKDLTGTVPDVTFEPRGLVALKGFPEPWQLHAVKWRDMDVGHPTPTVGRRTTPSLPLSSFVGRDDDAARVIALLDACRIVTVCGPGGVGKSRLARHVAHAVADRYDDGVIWVELSSMRDPADVPGALAAELRLNAVVGRRTLGSDRRGARRAQPTDRARQLRAPGRSSGCAGRVHRGRGRSGRPPADEPGTVAGGRRARVDTGPAG